MPRLLLTFILLGICFLLGLTQPYDPTQSVTAISTWRTNSALAASSTVQEVSTPTDTTATVVTTVSAALARNVNRVFLQFGTNPCQTTAIVDGQGVSAPSGFNCQTMDTTPSASLSY